MPYFLVLLPATMLTVAGYVVLFLSGRSEGALRTFGRYLGYWTFALAALCILGAIFAAAHGGHRCPFFGTHGMHERMYGPAPDIRPPADASSPSAAPSVTPSPTESATAPPTPNG